MKKVVVRIKGGLGNQMFQYAAARALASRNNAELVLDTFSGFATDKLFRRSYSLGPFPIKYRKANLAEQSPFWCERALLRVSSVGKRPNIFKRPWGIFAEENESKYLPEVNDLRGRDSVWMDGHWQSERYFADYRKTIGRELAPPDPIDPVFLAMAKKMINCNSVAVGVRLYEESPKGSNPLVAPFSFYRCAAIMIAEEIDNPVFFVFCTKDVGLEGKIQLPGKAYYITHDNGYLGAVERIWLFSQCKNFVISNSSFYWWGAWLSELENPGGKIIACDIPFNSDNIPSRWVALKP